MILTPNQIADVLSIIEKYHIVFAAHAVGVEVLSDYDKQILTSAGIDLDDLLDSESYLSQSFKFGMLSDAIGEAKAKKLTYKQFRDFLRSGQFIPLTTPEKERLNVIKNRTYGDIRTLGSKITEDTRKIILEEAEKSIEDKANIRQMAIEIGKRTENWSRDFDRISDYVTHTAFNEGRAVNLEKEGRDKRVYFDTYPGACKHCLRLLKTKGVSSEPKIFTISELRANGTNIGRKVSDWKPTIGPIHPWCRCTIHSVPEGYEWNEKTQSFDIPKEFERKVKRRSKVGVTVDGETTEI